ncbi:MAG: glycosyltransferase family A protein [Trueperaceae bacterium]
MTGQPLVTIGISTYNRAGSYLWQALDSALAQTYRNVEVLVSDNCSTDHTEELVRARSAPRLRYVRQERNIGANPNFNFCLEEARGKYFLLLHDDDRIDADFVANCMQAVEETGDVGLVRSGTRVIDGDGKVLAEDRNTSAGLSAGELFLSWFARGTSFYLCSTLYNTAYLRRHGGFQSRNNLLQDVAAIAELSVRYGRADVPGVKASFRRHDGNKGSRDAALLWADDSLYLLDLLERLLPEHARALRQAGLPYLSRKCYRNAATIRSIGERWRTYLAIHDRLGRSYSPMRWALEHAMSEARVSLGETLRSAGHKARSLQPS